VAVAVKLPDNAGIGVGAAVALADGPVQLFTVCVTVYVPAGTVIELPVALLLHKNVAPEAPVAVNSEVPQLSTTETPGAAGIDFGAAVAFAIGPVQPFTVCVTV